LKKRGEKGISTSAGAVLFVILIFTIQTILFLAVFRYNSYVQDAIKTEGERMQEKIVLASLLTENSTGIENIYALLVNNTGGITVRIRAIYIDNQFLCDPSDTSINPNDAYVNDKETSWILVPRGIGYSPLSQITVATERGTKSTNYEWVLKQFGGEVPPIKFEKFYLGPLMLDFTKFYYATVDSQTGSLTSDWMYGWEVFAGSGPLAWKITVKNIDDRDITLNQFSVFTLWANDQPSNRLPWYIEPPPNRLTQHIKANETVEIVYKWATPKTNSTKTPNTQGIYNTESRCRTFLTFFGIFHELDGTTKPYGQTIPFEAVLVDKVSIQVTASPSVIASNSSMYSTITAVVTRNREPASGVNVTFTTTAGTLSESWVITDASGTAKVYLYPGISAATAIVTAKWITISGSTTVRIETPTVQVRASPSVIVIKSTINSTISATVTLGGTPVIGANVTFTTTAGNLSSSWALTDATGTARVTLTARFWTSPTSATVTAAYLYKIGLTTVVFTVETIQVTASPEVIAVNSTMKSRITATVTVGATPIVGANVTFTTNSSSLSSLWAITDAAGAASVYLDAGTYPATANVTATWINTFGSAIVRFTNLYVTTDKQIYTQNDTVKISGLLRDDIGAPIQGVVVSLNITASNGTVIWSVNSTPTDIDGAFTYDLQLVNATRDTYIIIANWQTYEEKYCKFTVA